MAYGDHTVWAPQKRWSLMVGYWAVAFVLAWTRGLQAEILKLNVKIPDHGMYFVSFIGFIPIFIAAYDISAYAFNRKLSIFSTIVFPLGHINDTLRWYFTFDIGRAITVFVGGKVMDGEMPMWMKFIGGWAAFAIFMMIHRANFEISYLPEHRKLFYSFTNATTLEQQQHFGKKI